MTRVKLPVGLRRYAGGAGELEIGCTSVGQCVEELERRFPAISREMRDEGGDLAPLVHLYVNGQDVRYLAGLETPLVAEDLLTILMPVAGGAGRHGDSGTR